MSGNKETPGNSTTMENNQMVIIRILDAPRDLVFKVWSEVEHLQKWWGPIGMDIRDVKLDFRAGGSFHYSMAAPDGNKMWGKFTYHEINPPEKIVWINSFSDPEANVVRPAFSDLFPIEIHNVVTFEEAGDGRTKLTLRGGPINATEAELNFYSGMFGSMKQGFNGTFDQLDKYLAAQIR